MLPSVLQAVGGASSSLPWMRKLVGSFTPVGEKSIVKTDVLTWTAPASWTTLTSGSPSGGSPGSPQAPTTTRAAAHFVRIPITRSEYRVAVGHGQRVSLAGVRDPMRRRIAAAALVAFVMLTSRGAVADP